MNNNNEGKEGQDHIKDFNNHKFNWKMVHHSWIFWVFLFLMLAGILFYIVSVDFGVMPNQQLKQPSENSITH